MTVGFALDHNAGKQVFNRTYVQRTYSLFYLTRFDSIEIDSRGADGVLIGKTHEVGEREIRRRSLYPSLSIENRFGETSGAWMLLNKFVCG